MFAHKTGVTAVLPQTNQDGQDISIVCHEGSLFEIPEKTNCLYFLSFMYTDASKQKRAHLPMIFLPSFLTCSYSSLSSSERVTCCINTLRSGNCTSVLPATLLFLVRLNVIPFTSACKFLNIQYMVEKFKGCDLGRSYC